MYVCMIYQKLLERLCLYLPKIRQFCQNRARTENEAKHKLQNVLTLALEWSRKWCLKLNSSKSTHVDFINKSILVTPIFRDILKYIYQNISQSFWQKSAEIQSPKKYFSYFVLMSGLELESWLFV